MGGEPTFVSIDDMDGDGVEHGRPGRHEAASSPASLLKRLQDRFAPGALLHYGQGKLYPGEPLPRWALGCFWRARRRADLGKPGPDRRRVARLRPHPG